MGHQQHRQRILGDVQSRRVEEIIYPASKDARLRRDHAFLRFIGDQPRVGAFMRAESEDMRGLGRGGSLGKTLIGLVVAVMIATPLRESR